jgi:glutathione S-transferase
MSLTLHFHPLSSFCWKALIALYENDTPFAANQVDLGNPAEREALLKLSPIGRFPVLEDTARREVVPESTIIIEYLDRHYPGPTRFIPADAEAALQTRLRDRFLDLYLHLQMQKVRRRPLASRGRQGPARRGAGEDADPQILRHSRRAAGGRRMGHGGQFRPRRLRGGAVPVLLQPDRAVRGAPEARRLFPAVAGACLLWARIERGRAVFRDVPEGGCGAVRGKVMRSTRK